MRRVIVLCALGALCVAVGLRGQSTPAEQKPAEQQPADQPPAKEDDPGRPVLRHGGPAKKRTDSGPTKTEENIPQPLRNQQKDDAPAAQTERDDRPILKRDPQPPMDADDRPMMRRLPPEEALIELTRDVVMSFIDDLPNFVCDQITKRYESKTVKPEWKYKDRIEVELFFTNGQEDYQKVRLNGRRLKKGSPEDSGQWSTGELGGVLGDIFHQPSNARFKLRGDSTAAGVKAKEYAYSVIREDSHWTIRMGRSVRPAYSGAVWIAPATGQVLRVEMSTTSLPTDYEYDKVEETIDYDWVPIGDRKYLLPVRSANLACHFHSFDCNKNEIEFKNYRKFNVESQVLATDSEITFPEEEESDKKKPAGKYEPPQITTKPDETPKQSEPPKP